jgi:hypothetical protein
MAVSGRGTVVKVNTETGVILGEYQTAPDGRGRNPSRTTVDFNGNVWTGNRDEKSGGKGSVVQLGLLENNQCVDRNGNGVIDTSTGLGDVRAWPNPDGVDDNGGVASAEDECIIHYVRVDGDGIRHVSVDENNNVWVGGSLSGSDNAFNLLDGTTGAILAGFNVGGGGYGGLVDRNGVLWSAGREPGSPNVLLRYDTKKTLSTADDSWQFLGSHLSYGVAADCYGNIWNTQFDANKVAKFDASGSLFSGFPKATGGGTYDRGIAVTPDCDVWVANSGGRDVSRLDNDGNLNAVIDLGDDGYTPTGVAVDAAGKVWVTCYSSHTAKRIDPATNTVDLTISLGANAYPYNYSDMTGQLSRNETSPRGTWTVVHDSGRPTTGWGIVHWDSYEPSGSHVSARARTAETIAGLGAATFTPVSNGIEFHAPGGRYIEVEMRLTPNSEGISPVVYSVTVEKEAECTNPCTPIAPNDVTCDAVDDDCDGWIDEDYVAATTTCGVGACASTGVTSCINGLVVDSCDAGTAAADTACNGIDDDCDGLVDEDFIPSATRCGIGVCTSTGVTSCVGGHLQDSCLPGQPTLTDATCNGLDEDCDGAVDEDFVPTAVSCGVGACSSTGQTQCIRGHVVDRCIPGAPGAEICDGLDNDCNGLVDDGFGPGVVTVNIDPAVLWPPNHRMVDIHATITVSGSCSTVCPVPPNIVLVSAASNEPDDANGVGDGHTTNDIQDAATGAADFDLKLRAERDGNGVGRRYRVTYSATDCFGATGVGYADVLVPHDQGGVTEPVQLSAENDDHGTVLLWNAVPVARSYQVIRGNLSSVTDAGDFIDLGRVSCIRPDSPATSTKGSQDTENPAPGHGFFYLVAYSDEWGTSGYGTASVTKPRVASSGDCE